VKTTHKLTVTGINALTAPGRHSDGANLYLSVSPANTKSWTFVYRFHSRTREAGLGKYPDVSLKEARDKAAQGRALLNAKPKIDPLTVWQAEAKAQCKPTFEEAARAYIAAHEDSWRSEVHRGQWLITLGLERPRKGKVEFGKPLLNLKVDEIGAQDVLRVLKPVWKRAPETASRMRGRIERVLAAAQAEGHIPADRLNPARWRGHLDTLLPGRKAIDRGHHEAMAYEEAPAFVARLRERRRDEDGNINLGAFAFELLVLTATRTSEVLGARWEEIDFDKRLWTIPKERMKGGRAFEIPLADGAMAILAETLAIRSDDLVFSRGEPYARLGPATFIRLLRAMRVAATAHGYRSAFRDWAGNETSFPRDICEMALAHSVGDRTERAYRRQSALAKRRDLMAAWDRYLAGPASAGVIEMRPSHRQPQAKAG
jgi:integrase